MQRKSRRGLFRLPCRSFGEQWHRGDGLEMVLSRWRRPPSLRTLTLLLVASEASSFINRSHRSTATTTMRVKVGIVGLPNVGKSTLFNVMAQKSIAQAANFPFCTVEPNLAMIAVPDETLVGLQSFVHTG